MVIWYIIRNTIFIHLLMGPDTVLNKHPVPMLEFSIFLFTTGYQNGLRVHFTLSMGSIFKGSKNGHSVNLTLHLHIVLRS
jgi:hypothetical protein